jgi:hypothetical protein
LKVPLQQLLTLTLAAFLKENAEALLRDSVDAGDADLWGDTIRHALVDASLKLFDEAAALKRQTLDRPEFQ